MFVCCDVGPGATADCCSTWQVQPPALDTCTQTLNCILSPPPHTQAATPLAEALAGTGFDPSQPALFSAQGLVYYLPPEAVQQLLTAVRGLAAPGSRLVFDFMREWPQLGG